MLYFNSILILATVLCLYVYLSSTGVVALAGVAQVLAALALVFEQSTYAIWALWQYLCEYSFCPWLMIFKGRKSSVIIEQATNYANAAGNSDSLYGAFTNSIESVVSICELFVGPFIGIALGLLQMFLCFKATAVCFSKLFNLFK